MDYGHEAIWWISGHSHPVQPKLCTRWIINYSSFPPTSEIWAVLLSYLSHPPCPPPQVPLDQASLWINTQLFAGEVNHHPALNCAHHEDEEEDRTRDGVSAPVTRWRRDCKLVALRIKTSRISCSRLGIMFHVNICSFSFSTKITLSSPGLAFIPIWPHSCTPLLVRKRGSPDCHCPQESLLFHPGPAFLFALTCLALEAFEFAIPALRLQPK